MSADQEAGNDRPPTGEAANGEPEREQPHLSIGEVLRTLHDEFPDVTISKIRFLESQGLIDPERTPSGYRKFSDDDLDRLRWILGQQRDHFLPLRVIKERLDELGPGAPPVDEPEPDGEPVAPGAEDAPTTEAGEAAAAKPKRRRKASALTLPLAGLDAEEAAAAGEAPSHGRRRRRGRRASSTGPSRRDQPASTTPARRARGARAVVTPVEGEGAHSIYDERRCSSRRPPPDSIATGIQARHLKMYKHFADREARCSPRCWSRTCASATRLARARLEEELEELARLGRRVAHRCCCAAPCDELAE